MYYLIIFVKTNVAKMKKIETFINIEKRDQYIRDIAHSFKKSRILFTSLELSLFTIIGNEAKTLKSIAEESSCNERALEKILNALVNMGFLNFKNGFYSNTPDSLVFLSKESPNYLGDLMHIASLWENWSNLTEIVIKGKPVKYQSLSEKSNEWLEAFILASFRESKNYANVITRQIPAQNPMKILDLGAGSGVFSIELAKLYPKAQIYAFELPKVSELTQKFIDRSGLSERIHIISGDFTRDEIGSDYDLVLISDVLSEYSFRTVMSTLKKVYDSMKFRGVVAIFDYIFDDKRTSPTEVVTHSINMLINTLDGEVLANTDIWFAMKEAWFSDIYKIETNFGKSLVIGFK